MTAPNPAPMTIDDMIEFLAQMRRASPLGGDTVVIWCEPDREHIPVTGIRLETDDDGALATIIGDTSMAPLLAGTDPLQNRKPPA